LWEIEVHDKDLWHRHRVLLHWQPARPSYFHGDLGRARSHGPAYAAIARLNLGIPIILDHVLD
jgi:hypothetical protein